MEDKYEGKNALYNIVTNCDYGLCIDMDKVDVDSFEYACDTYNELECDLVFNGPVEGLRALRLYCRLINFIPLFTKYGLLFVKN